ncbi:MAG TPA: hypothetical protein VGM39_08075, partial [Kofleriaceae bacterium]
MISQGCDRPSHADPAPTSSQTAPTPRAPAASREAAHGETCLGVSDLGIWDDLDPQVQITLP